MLIKKNHCSLIQQRWIVALFCFLGLFTAYSQQFCVPITLTEMVLPINRTGNTSSTNECQSIDNVDAAEVTKSPSKVLYSWSEETQSFIMSSFYWTYPITQIPGGMIAEKYGGKHVLGVGLVISSLFTLLTPLCIEWAGSTGWIITGALVGLGQGVMYPSIAVLLAKWIPPIERSRTGAFVYAGQCVGQIFGNAGAGLMIHYTESVWGVFYVIGTIGLLWYPLWLILCYDSPRQHPFITDAELTELDAQLDGRKDDEKPGPTPWRSMLTSSAVWSAIIGLFGFDLFSFALLPDLPRYASSVLKLPVKINGYLNSLVYLSMWIGGLATAWLSDYAIRSQFFSKTNARKVGATLALFCAACFFVGASYAGCDPTLVTVMFVIAIGINGAGFSCIMVNPLDISPNYSGSINALSSTVAAIISGTLPLYLIGVMTPHGTLSEWRTCFWIAFIAIGISNLFFLVFGKGEVESWDDPRFERST